MSFVNSYAFAQDGSFRKVIALADGLLAVGSHGTDGLAVRTNPDGTVAWARTFNQQGSLVIPGFRSRLAFVDAVAADAGGFAVLGSFSLPDMVAASASNAALTLLRIDGQGNLLWSRSFGAGTDVSRIVRRPSSPEEFLVYTRVEQTPATYGHGVVDLMRFGAGGALLNAARLSTDAGGRVFDAMAVKTGYLLVGDYGMAMSQAQWVQGGAVQDFESLGAHGLVIALDGALATCSSHVLERRGVPTGQVSLRALCEDASGAVLITGAATDATGTVEAFVVTVEAAELGTLSGYAFAPDEPHTRPRRIVCPETSGSGPPPDVDPDYLVESPRLGAPPPGNALVLIGHLTDAAAEISQVVRVDATLGADANHGFNFTGYASIHDLAAADGGAAICGQMDSTAPGAFLLSSDEALICCRTRDLPVPAKTAIVFDHQLAFCTLTKTDARVSVATLQTEPAAFKVLPLCAGLAVDLGDGTLLQSPHLNLQAAGSDGTDASRGILLRWFLTGKLADHLPKGNLAQGALNFNKPDDFVTLYRAEFPAGVATRKLDFASDFPVHLDGDTLYFQTGTVTPKDLFAVRFLDAAAFATAQQSANPLANFAAFLAAYGANPFEVELRDTVSVACDLQFQAGASVQVETRSVGEAGILAEKFVTTRRTLGAGDGPTARLTAENMRSVRLRAGAGQIQSVAFLRYADVIGDVNARQAWTELGKFALSLDQTEVFARLEDPPRFTVHDLWRKFDAAARVDVANYHTRWSDPTQGLGAAVQTYVQLSETDPDATAALQGAQPEDGAISVSYRDLLQITAAGDYHAARMLGLGYVDAAVVEAPSYIHLIAYRSLVDLGDGKGPRDARHVYMSLPTTLAQSRLPLTPDLGTIQYGLSVPTGSGDPYALTDAAGYTPDGTARFIRLNPGCRPLYVPGGDFFDPPDAIDYSAASLPVLYGIQYRRRDASAWLSPAIAHDTVFRDTASVAEMLTTPFPETQFASGFLHKETEPGVHVYAVFGVNLFSRASPLGPPLATDATQFTRRNTLLPPSDLQVQFIQPESPLVLTTNYEQTLLTQLGSGDQTLVRFCCNYGMAQEAAYGFGHTIELLHRRDLPANITGGVAAIGPASDPALLRIATQPYTFSTNGQTATPSLAQSAKDHFVGGVLVAGGTRLTVEDIEWPGGTGDNPIFIVRKPVMTGVVQDEGGNTLTVKDAPLSIAPGDLVMAVENMAAAATWGGGNPLAATIQIGDTSWTARTEGFTRADGTSVSRNLRGAWDTATVSAASSGDPLKLYDIVFDHYVLAAHPQSGDPLHPVDWWKGTVRLPVVGRDPEDRRTLKVAQIVSNLGARLELRAVDDSGDAADVVVGAGQRVNYYPGYIAYLRADGARDFDASHLMPATGEGSRTSLIGARTVDGTTLDGAGQAYRSAMSVPQLVAALEIREPKAPRRPRGLAYATPPDEQGKSSYTLTVEFEHEPFAAVFYRADALNMLASLYGDASLAAIRAVLFPPQGDVWLPTRFTDLFAYLDDARAAPDPIPDAAGFAMPLPDAEDFHFAPGPLSAIDKQKAKDALFGAFVPLSEQPLIYDFISTDPHFAPSRRPQSFRNANGDVLPPGDPGFDLSPMAMRPAAGTVRFVDFTLDGSMNPNTLYFYCAREIGNLMQLGDASPIFGPVKLVNLAPAPAPRLRKLTSVPADRATQSGPRVDFAVIAPAAIDPMFALRIYRATSALDALSVRTMRALPDVALATLTASAEGVLTVSDDFASDAFVPYGDPLFYRLAWVRKVDWVDAGNVPQSALAVSDPTRTFLANVIDVINPPAPVPTFGILSTAANGDKFLRATWDMTAYNATYYLSRLGERGNWMRLGTLKSNAATMSLDLGDPLPPVNEDGDPIYYRFKVDLENASGLLNTASAPVTARLDQLGPA